MSGVILRCPNCGTGRAAAGECDACHEAEVRYFCTNHTPGLWLDGKACTRCGDRFGQAPRAAAVSPGRPPLSRAGGATPTRRSTEEVFGRLEEPAPSRAPTPEEMLAAAVRIRKAARRPTMGPALDVSATTGRLGGCLVRAVVLLFVFVLMMVSGVFMFAGSMFRVW